MSFSMANTDLVERFAQSMIALSLPLMEAGC